MSTAAPETPAPEAPAAPVEAPKPAAPAATTPPVPVTPPEPKVEDLPDWAQQIIKDARADAGRARTTAKEQAAAEARTEMARVLAKAAGIELPGDKPDPEKLAADLTTARTEGIQAVLQLAVYKAAGAPGVNANPDALLDSLSFQTAVKDLDPKAADFGAKVTEAIKTALAANPSFKAGRAPGASGVDMTGGSGGEAQITEDQLALMTPEQIVDAQNKGLLVNLGVGKPKS